LPSPRIEIENRIQAAAKATIEEIGKTDAELVEAIAHRNDLHLIINSSFLYREKRAVKTLQSQRRLVAKVSVAGKHMQSESVAVTDGNALKVHYRLAAPQDIPEIVPLRDAVSQEISSVGDLIFVLIGTVKGLRPSAQSADADAVKELRLSPSLSGDFEKVDAGVYAIRKILPIEDLLERISSDLNPQGGLSAEDRRRVAKAYDALLDNATTDVVMQKGRAVRPKETTLGQIVDSLRSQTTEYRKALKLLQSSSSDRQALNEVLRIAYNFSTDVLPLLFLFMSMCDLKPLVFWCTVDKQWALYSAFASLPWSALGRKEKLDEYQAIVSEARNHAFHHVLPFDATVEVDLSGWDVRAERIRLFTPFGQKQGRGVRLKDQELADVFAEFSRARQRPVSNVFWEANLRVMEAACELSRAVLDTLLLIHAARKAGR
jgi:hypothetical protein